MKKNDIIKITITDIAEDGSGIGRHENMVVFCRGMLPGETGDVRIIKVTKSYCIGKLINLETKSLERLEPPCCDNFPKGCGGCTFCHLSYSAQLKYKERRVADCIERIGGFDSVCDITKPILPSELTKGYRNKAIYPFSFDNASKSVVCGFYAPASHRVVPISENTECGLENNLSAQIRRFTTKFVNDRQISPYNEDTGSGILRALMIRTDRNATVAMAVLIINSKEIPSWAYEYAAELSLYVSGVTSVYLCLNTKNTNVVLSGDMHLLLGKETISDIIGNFDGAPSFEISPLSFYQVNPHQTEKLYDAVYNVLPHNLLKITDSALIYDIYCGIGTIGLYLLSRLKSQNCSLVGVEYVSSAVDNAKKNAERNGFAERSEFFCGDAAVVTPEIIAKYGKPTVVILDPPRKGCDESLIETVLSADADCVIYVSCNPATLARDMKLLCLNKYTCTSIQPVDMFPQSGHVETVVLLSRKKVDEERSVYKSWSDLKKQMNSLLCDSLKDKISYFYTSYHEVHNAYGRATINYNKKEIIAFSWLERYTQQGDIVAQYEKMDNASLVFDDCMQKYEFAKITATKDKWMPNCTLCETDFINSMTIYLKTNITSSLHSDNYLLRVFAYMDRRVGKRSLIKIKDEVEKLPDWVKQFYQIRCEADGISFPQTHYINN